MIDHRIRRSRLVLVDDDDNCLLLAKRVFQRDFPDCELSMYADGAAAIADLDRMEQRPPDLVLLDLNMPRASGFEVLRSLRERESLAQVPVVVLSSSARREDVEKSYRLGANGFVTKPFESRQPGAYFADIGRYWLHLNKTSAGSELR